MIRALLILLLVASVGLGGGLYVAASRAQGPVIDITSPGPLVGRESTFEATVETPDNELNALDAFIEQDGERYPLFSLTGTGQGQISQAGVDRVRVRRQFDRQSHGELVAGEARIVVTATRPVFFGLREVSSQSEAVVEIRLDPPRVEVRSDLHYINHGGTELVVYRVTPPDSESGVEVGDRFYPGYPVAGAGYEGNSDNALRMAFFALSYDQDLNTQIQLVARDAASNESRVNFDYRVFPREFRRSEISISDRFLRRVVPAIVAAAPELADERIEPDVAIEELVDLYLFVNGTLRESNRTTIASLAEATSSQMQWSGPFRQLANTAVQSGFADHRTYVHGGNEIDQQVHLGFDLASTANAPVRTANAGTVVFADYLGIYGNCVVVDHGMGLQSLYAHLSSLRVARGESVTVDQVLGQSGQTGLAGGDHLHFAMLLGGRPVTPVEWWDPHWIEDRIHRKLRPPEDE